MRPNITFENRYVCPNEACKTTWTDHWSAACDDDCPKCGARHISPVESTEVVTRNDVADESTLTQSIRFNPRQLATILAALRHYQQDLADADADESNDNPIATDGGRLVPMTVAEIDALCEEINQ